MNDGDNYPADLLQGWGWPLCSRKAHYFTAGSTRSLCGKIGLYAGTREDRHHESPDNCAACMKRQRKEFPGEQEATR